MSDKKQSRNFFEQREFVRSLLEQVEIEKSILEELEPDENAKEAEIVYSIAEELICPISYSFMIDPVFLSSGKTYERSSINNKEQNLTCPNILAPNLQMRSITRKFVETYKNDTRNGPTWKEIRRLCNDYIKEQEPQKIQHRKDAEEKRNAQEQIVREQKRIIREQEKFERQKRVEEDRRYEYGIDYDCFCIEYESFFRFCKNQSVINDSHDDTDILTKWISGKRAVRLMLSEKYPGVTFSLNGKGGPFRLKWYLQLFMENFARSFGNIYYNRLR
jgi:hypothetical protein